MTTSIKIKKIYLTKRIKYKVLYFILFFVFSLIPIFAFDHSYQKYHSVLEKYVPRGKVNYTELQKNQTNLNYALRELSQVTPKEYEQFSKKQKIAFFINAYNIFTIRLILDHYPLKSIKDIKEEGLTSFFLNNPWKIEFFELLGKKRYLDWIEHDILRSKFKETRSHFALVCASKSCPILINEPYLAHKLDTQFETSGKRFFNDRSRNYYDKQKNILFLSKILDWFEEDFTREGTLVEFVQKYMNTKIPKSVKIKYLHYDWDLNDKKEF